MLSRRDMPRDTWMDPIQRIFNSFGLGAAGNRIGDWDMWSPQIETFQRADQLVVRADLPGLSKDDVNVEVTDDAIVISGERRHEFEDERDGIYRSERSYGSFYRTIPLPEGAIADNAKADFKDGVLEITMPAPPRDARRGRRIEIGSGEGRTK
jgi:HSP20 family protein